MLRRTKGKTLEFEISQSKSGMSHNPQLSQNDNMEEELNI